MDKKYPYIYSFSTIGLIHHYNSDYLLHPLRTDFIGESGSGKSMVADLLQLIFVGHEHYESATDKSRSIAKIALEAFGYAFVNVEIDEGQFITMGVFLEQGKNASRHFIIQNSYKWEGEDVLEGIRKALRYKDLLEDDNILQIDDLCKMLDSQERKEENRYVCKAFSIDKFHKILYENRLLPIDMASKDKKTLKTYAQIIRSFSRGKGLVFESQHLKKFIFGEADGVEIENDFHKELENLKEHYENHAQNERDRDKINNIQNDLRALQSLYETKQKKHREYITAEIVYSYKLLSGYEEELKTKTQTLLQNKIQVNLLEQRQFEIYLKDISDFEIVSKRNQYLDKKGNQIKRILPILSENNRIISTLDNLLLRYTTIEELKAAHKNELFNQAQKKVLKDFSSDIKSLEISEETFEKSYWLKMTFEQAKEKYKKELLEINEKIVFWEAIASWKIDKNKPFLLDRAIKKGIPIDEIIGNILLYFQVFPQEKPNNQESGNRYLYSVDELLEDYPNNIQVDAKKTGIWFNAKGVSEYIPIRYADIFKGNINDIIQSIQQDVERNLKTHKEHYKQLTQIGALHENLRNVSLLSAIEYYQIKGEILDFSNDEVLQTLSEKMFADYLTIYSTKPRAENLKSRFAFVSERQKQVNEEKTLNKPKWERLSDSVEKIPFKIEDIKQKVEEKNISYKQLIQEANDTKTPIISLNKGLYKELQDFSNNISPLLRQKKVDIETIKTEIEGKEEDKGLNQKISDTKGNYNTSVIELKAYFDLEYAESEIQGMLRLYKENPKRDNGEKWVYDEALRDYNSKFDQIVNDYIRSLSYLFGGKSKDFGVLIHKLLPDIFPMNEPLSEDVWQKIDSHLRSINQKILLFENLKLSALKKVIQKVKNTYENYLHILAEMKRFFADNDKRITGGYQVVLKHSEAKNYPIDWFEAFNTSVSNSEIEYHNLPNSLFSKQTESIDKIMMEAYINCGGTLLPHEVNVKNLLNPLNYFDLFFSMKDEKGNIQSVNEGSQGQKYAATSLLCIARIAKAESDSFREKSKQKRKGIRFMPIDEAEGLGSNYDMLHKIAETETYQIISMSINSVEMSDIEDEFYVYELQSTKNQIRKINPPAFGIFAGVRIGDLRKFYNSKF